MPNEKYSNILPEVPDSVDPGSYLELLLKITDDFRCSRRDLCDFKAYCSDDIWVRALYRKLLQKNDRLSRRLCLNLGLTLQDQQTGYNDAMRFDSYYKETFAEQSDHIRTLCWSLIPFLNAADELVIFVLHESWWTEHVIPELERLCAQVDALSARLTALQQSQSSKHQADFAQIMNNLQNFIQEFYWSLENHRRILADTTGDKAKLLAVLYGKDEAAKIAPRYTPAALLDKQNCFARAAKMRLPSYLRLEKQGRTIPMQGVEERKNERIGNPTVQIMCNQFENWEKERRGFNVTFPKRYQFFESILNLLETASNATSNQENSPP